MFLKKTCTNCGNDSIKETAAVEVVAAFFERANRRLWITVLVLIGLFLATNIGWLVYESQFATIETTIEAEQDGGGTNIIAGGDLSYGAETQDNNETTDS